MDPEVGSEGWCPMTNDSFPEGRPTPDAFVRPGQLPPSVPPPAPPLPSGGSLPGGYPPPAADAQPYFAAPPPAHGTPPLPPAAGPSEPYPFTASATPPPWAGSAPRALGGATAVGGPRRRTATPRILAGVGSIAAIAILVGASGVFGRTSVSAVPQTNQQPAASAPAAGTAPATQNPVQNPGASQPSTNTGTSASTGQADATAAQSTGVVLINTTVAGGSAAGTGMVLEASGLVLTNYHVVEGSTAIKVTIASSGKTYSATVVGHDATDDVALLQLSGASGLATVTIDRDAVANGDKVTAVGNAQGQQYLTAASGTITDTSTTVTVANDSASGSETLTDVYETNAKAQPGDSGGPLFDAENEVTGMTTAGQQTYRGPRSSSGQATTVTSYAIPIAHALSIVTQIESGTEVGDIQIGPKAYLGIMVSTGAGGSAVVSSVTAGTPAAKAGIEDGSTITRIGTTAVATQAEIAQALAGHDPGDVVKVAWTDASGTEHSANVTLGASPAN